MGCVSADIIDLITLWTMPGPYLWTLAGVRPWEPNLGKGTHGWELLRVLGFCLLAENLRKGHFETPCCKGRTVPWPPRRKLGSWR